MALGHAPFELWFVAFPGLCLAIWLVRFAPDMRAGAGLGWIVGVAYFGLALHWIVEPFFVDAALTGWMAPLALLGLAGGLALFWAAAFGVAAGFGAARSEALIVSLAAAELARAYLLTGFPWALLSYIWLETPLVHWAALVGPHGLLVLTLALAVLSVRTLDPGGNRTARVAAPLIAAGALAGGGLWQRPAPADLEDRPIVRLVQPNAPQDQKWDPAHIQTFHDRLIAFTGAPPVQKTRPSLILWPETAVPVALHRADGVLQAVARAAGGVPVALGIQRQSETGWHNSMVVLDAQGAVSDIYDKHHLVPFGEYMPWPALWRRIEIGGLAARADGAYRPGPGPVVFDLGDGLGHALPLICYEAVFPQNVNAFAKRPDLILHLTNDAWFGEFSGPYQHLAQARFRAIEQALPVLRSANTGVSAVIDPAGRVLASLPLGEAGFTDAAIPTPGAPTLYSRTGDLPVLVMLALGAFGLFLRRVGRSGLSD